MSKAIKKKTKQKQEKRLVGDQAKVTYLNTFGLYYF
jgi:hypothetical protein